MFWGRMIVRYGNIREKIHKLMFIVKKIFRQNLDNKIKGVFKIKLGNVDL